MRIEKEINQVFVKAPFIFEKRKKTVEVSHDDVLVRIKSCGICGSDIQRAKNGAIEFTHVGHEIAGTVEAIGENINRFKKGDLVVAENHTLCGVCESCKNGMPAFCKNIKTYYGQEGGMADYILVHNSMLYPYNSLTFEEAVMAEPLTVALDIVKACDIQLNSTVAVFGAGTIGLLILQLVKQMGAKNIMLVDSSLKDPQSSFRLNTGKSLGADKIIGYEDDDFIDFVEDEYPEGFDRVIITSPPATIRGAIKIAKFGGIIGLIGIVYGPDSIVSFDMNEFHFKRLQLRCIHPTPNLYFPLALNLLNNKKVTVDKIITHRIDFENYRDAFDIVQNKKQHAIKIIINMK